MATLAQTTANRANAQLSTGPRSVEGKAASSRNAIKSGAYSEAYVIPGEDPAELDALADQYIACYRPVGPIELALIEKAVRSHWMERRYCRIEAEILRIRAEAQPDAVDPIGAGVIYDAEHGNTLGRIHRRQLAAHREFLTAIDLFGKFAAHRRAADAQAAATAAVPAPRAPQPRQLTPDWVRFAQDPAPQPQPAKTTRESDANLALRL